jgi:starch synthase
VAGGILRYREQDVYGSNGIDDREWNPARDRLIAARYTATNPSGKQVCKRDLLETFGLSPEWMNAPVVGMTSRLVDQKGFDLIESAIHRMLALDLGLVVLGTGEARYEEFLRQLRQRYAGKVGVTVGFDNVLSHKIKAGSDIFLMPSRFEPCGLNQMYSLRYGAVPVVHATGGLDDTIESYEPTFDRGNGFTAPYDAEALLATLQRALTLYRDRAAWVRSCSAACRQTSRGQNLPKRMPTSMPQRWPDGGGGGAGVMRFPSNRSFRVGDVVWLCHSPASP